MIAKKVWVIDASEVHTIEQLNRLIDKEWVDQSSFNAPRPDKILVNSWLDKAINELSRVPHKVTHFRSIPFEVIK